MQLSNCKKSSLFLHTLNNVHHYNLDYKETRKENHASNIDYGILPNTSCTIRIGFFLLVFKSKKKSGDKIFYVRKLFYLLRCVYLHSLYFIQ